MTDDSKRRVRLAYILRPAAGGMRRHVETLLTHLDRRRYKITLFAPSDTDLSVPHAAIHRVPLSINSRTSLFDLTLIRRLSQDLSGNFDLVHAHGLRGALIGVLAAERAGIPSLFTAHNLAVDLSLAARLGLVFVARRANRIIAVSQAVAETLVSIGIAKDRIAVVPNGIDSTYFQCPPDGETVRSQYGIDADTTLIVAVGRFAPEKGFDVLIDALAYISKSLLPVGGPHLHLVLVGDGPQEAELRRRAENMQTQAPALASAPPVLFTGRLADPMPLLCAADIVVVPSRREGQGLVALEAMAAGKPVIASRVGGLCETIVEGVTGLLVPPDDPPALAEAMLSLLNPTGLRSAMGCAGKERVGREFTLVQMLARTEQVYKEILTCSAIQDSGQ